MSLFWLSSLRLAKFCLSSYCMYYKLNIKIDCHNKIGVVVFK